MTASALCAVCEQQPATVRLPHMYVCPACKALVEEEAGRRLRLLVAALEVASREEAA